MKIILFAFLLFAPLLCNSQTLDSLNKCTDSAKVKHSNSQNDSSIVSNAVLLQISSSNIDLANKYMKRATQFRNYAYGTLAFGTVVSIIGLATSNDRVKDKTDHNKTTQKACYISAGVLALATVVCASISINYSRGYLKLSTTESGGSISYTF